MIIQNYFCKGFNAGVKKIYTQLKQQAIPVIKGTGSRTAITNNKHKQRYPRPKTPRLSGMTMASHPRRYQAYHTTIPLLKTPRMIDFLYLFTEPDYQTPNNPAIFKPI